MLALVAARSRRRAAPRPARSARPESRGQALTACLAACLKSGTPGQVRKRSSPCASMTQTNYKHKQITKPPPTYDHHIKEQHVNGHQPLPRPQRQVEPRPGHREGGRRLGLLRRLHGAPPAAVRARRAGLAAGALLVSAQQNWDGRAACALYFTLLHSSGRLESTCRPGYRPTTHTKPSDALSLHPRGPSCTEPWPMQKPGPPARPPACPPSRPPAHRE